jgi:hypothetical protein
MKLNPTNDDVARVDELHGRLGGGSGWRDIKMAVGVPALEKLFEVGGSSCQGNVNNPQKFCQYFVCGDLNLVYTRNPS